MRRLMLLVFCLMMATISLAEDYLLAEAPVPDTVPYPGQLTTADAYSAWLEDVRSRSLDAAVYQALQPFFTQSAAAFLPDDSTANTAYSPLSAFLALGMLAEVSGGESRHEVLDVLGCKSVEELRTLLGALWLASYHDDGTSACKLSSAMWLRDGMAYRESALIALAEFSHAASFSGEMGSDGYNAALQSWLNQATGGLLHDQVGTMQFTAQTVMALTSAVYFSANWNDKFAPELTENGMFHAPTGDAEVPFMHRTYTGEVYRTDSFTAVNQALNYGSMWFFLPEEGVDAASLLQDEDALELLFGSDTLWEVPSVVINLAVPKFDVSVDFDLTGGLKELGVSRVFDPNQADFSPLTDRTDVFVSSAPHGVCVKIDEDGVEAASYTALIMCGMGLPPEQVVDFTLDRPFLFAVMTDDGLPVILGVVNQP